MKRRVLSVLCACVLFSASVVASQGGAKPKPVKPPKPTHTSVSTSVKPSSTKVKPVSVKTSTSKPPKPVKSTTTKGTKPAKTTKSAKADVKGKKSTTTASTSTATSTTETPTTTPAPDETTVPLTKVQEKLKKNTNLAAKLEGRLPEGTDLMTAAYGFKNLGQFVAAVNVSSNHEGIAFLDLKTLMVDEGYSLGQAMQKLKVTDATTEAGRAEYEANRMIQTSEVAAPSGVTATQPSTTTSSSTTSTTTSKGKSKNSKKAVGAQQ